MATDTPSTPDITPSRVPGYVAVGASGAVSSGVLVWVLSQLLTGAGAIGELRTGLAAEREARQELERGIVVRLDRIEKLLHGRRPFETAPSEEKAP